MEINSKIYVIDQSDNKPYECKIVGADVSNQKVKIHFVGWNDSHDEWLPMSSDRIIDDPSNSSLIAGSTSIPQRSPHDIKCQEILGKLLRNSDEVQKKVISGFMYDDNFMKNEKAFTKFQVPMLESTGEYLQIPLEDGNGKKLIKKVLIEKIINKLYAVLPSSCAECSEHYSRELGDETFFSCFQCQRGSHDCDKIKQFKALLPESLPKGFIWLCSICLGVDSSESVSYEPKSEAAGDKVVMQPSLSKEVTTSNTNTSDCSNHGKQKASKTKVCPKFSRGSCPHGLRGNKIVGGVKCQLDHPKQCWKYMNFGSKGPKGCRPGSNCTYYHPILCRFSVSDRVCTNVKCTYKHLRGTKREECENKSYSTLNKPKPLNSSNPSNIPKNGGMEKLEMLIIDLKKSQETEINLIRQELNAVRATHSQRNLGMMPPWYNMPNPYAVPYHMMLPPQAPPMGSVPQNLNPTNLNRLSPMGGEPPLNLGGRPSCF